MTSPASDALPTFLGIEGGGTRTVALLADASGRLLHRHEAGPANLKLLTDAQLLRQLRQIAREFPRPSAVAIGLAGARGEPEWTRIRAAAARVWPGVPCHATHDLETALAAGKNSKFKVQSSKLDQHAGCDATDSAFRIPHSAFTQVLVLSGTGSCCYGRAADGRVARFGGWGHILGDKGSGFEIGLRALKAVVFYLDCDDEWSALGQRLLRALQLNEPNDLIPWVQSAGKSDIAALAVEVFAAWSERDRIATDILIGAAASLAKDGVSCARKLAKPGDPVEFVLAGSVLLRQPRFAQKVARELRANRPGARVTPLRRESAWGAVALAAREFQFQGSKFKVAANTKHGTPLTRPAGTLSPRRTRGEGRGEGWPPGFSATEPAVVPAVIPLSPTELRHPRSTNLDRLPLADAIALMLDEDATIPAALLAERVKIERVVRLIVRAFRRGGRLFYAGAGTSGRLGVLDASECPPTFRTPPELVQGIMAGGQRALWSAVEGAEDDRAAGARAVEFRAVSKQDVVIGIAASGRTPFVWGALAAAHQRGAATVLLCFNPAVKKSHGVPGLILAPQIGPEILTGSTRLKAGTATKLLLNLFTTLAMVRLGKVVSNLMVDVNPSNVKLRDRAVRIVRELTGADAATARAALEQSGWVVKDAWQRAQSRARSRRAV